ncbi:MULTISPECIES: DUF6087 family protein [Streptomyces]|uniref:DUF6087 family protein n=1 Tax=Streptomyces TaxID=1883 RepID=UPI0022701F97|nr:MULTISPECIES: DUF6087 family protein [unclassified Streptomyces]MCY0923299.1 DUF6087 family protein [Streptomyces sp. H27-G5]MCY0943958.1 DUF6087 family protein [Streptomyces sp. H34-AA3]MCY0956322.1 DUF6087 family protein [Streptomyces sp. H27-H5]MCZ4082342.1 DUF6087 family protein [Streptomyces sp. H34-S5]
MDDEEPLSKWAERRDARIGRLRAIPITSGDNPKGSHINPDAPRAIERWNGHVWELHGFALNLAEAKFALHPEANAPTTPTADPVGQPLARGKGRHRKP